MRRRKAAPSESDAHVKMKVWRFETPDQVFVPAAREKKTLESSVLVGAHANNGSRKGVH
jgi:hypothetical protein